MPQYESESRYLEETLASLPHCKTIIVLKKGRPYKRIREDEEEGTCNSGPLIMAARVLTDRRSGEEFIEYWHSGGWVSRPGTGKEQQLQHKEQQLQHKEQQLQHKEQQLQYKEQQLQHKEQQLQHKEQQLQHKEQQLQHKEQQLQHKEQQLQHKEQQLQHKEQQLQHKEQQLLAL
nr:signal transducer and activator of transcription C-like [Procambarus clarkii]